MTQLVTRPHANYKNIVCGNQYRITILTSRLIRLEYKENGNFVDVASQTVINRDFEDSEYTVQDEEEFLAIMTKHLRLVYNKKAFSPEGLSIQVLGNLSVYHSLWHFGEQGRNLGGTARTLDEVNGACPLEDGLMSINGFAIMDDSRYYRYSEENYKELMLRFQKEQIPFSVAVIDMDWHLVDIDPKYGSGWTGFTWNKELFPNPASFMSWLHDHGLRVTLNVHPADGIRAYEEMYQDMAKALRGNLYSSNRILLRRLQISDMDGGVMISVDI